MTTVLLLRRALDRAALLARGFAVLLCVVVSVRFAIAAIQHALRVSQANFVQRPRPHTVSRVRPLPSAGASASASVWLRPAPGGHEALPSGRPVRVTLGVTVGAARSEVFVNGRRVGSTPYFGDVSCKIGQPLRIEVVAATGLPLAYDRECRGGTISLADPPP